MLIQHFCAENNVFAFLMRNYSFETMAVGALGACFLFNAKDKVETLWLFRKPFRVIICLLVPIFLCFNINIDNPLWKLLFRKSFLTLSSFIALPVPYLDDNHLPSRQEREPFLEIRWRNLLRHIHVSHGHCLSYDPLAQTP